MSEHVYSNEEIRQKAENLLIDHWDGNYPVHLENISKKLGFSVSLFEPSSNTMKIAGAVSHKKNVILLSNAIPETMRRFTFAHEIGHIILHPDTDEIDYREIISGENRRILSSKERQANEFAANILMPFDDFKFIWDNFKSLKNVANFFGVSEMAASIRAKKMNLDFSCV